MADLTNLRTFILPMATAIGAFGGFPAPPQFFTDLTKNELFRWALIFVLIWQGGGQQNVQISLATTAIFFLIVKGLQGIQAVRECPPVAPPAEEA